MINPGHITGAPITVKVRTLANPATINRHAAATKHRLSKLSFINLVTNPIY
jgi:hypothetical protein